MHGRILRMTSTLALIASFTVLLTCLSLVKCSNEVHQEDDSLSNHLKNNEESSSAQEYNLRAADGERKQPHSEQFAQLNDPQTGNSVVDTVRSNEIPKQDMQQNQIIPEKINSDEGEQLKGEIELEAPKQINTAPESTKKEILATSEDSCVSNNEASNAEAKGCNDVVDNTLNSVSKDGQLSDVGADSAKDNDLKHEQEDPEVNKKKQRYFPLLYTFGSLFTSFLAEFGGDSTSTDSSVAVNSSDSNLKNSSLFDGIILNGNSSTNGTDQGKKTRFQCALNSRNSSETMNLTSEVRIINSTQLLEILNFSKNQKMSLSPCVLVMFFTRWCHFSAKAAPQYNALARAFPQLDVLAVDTSHFSYLNAKFGTVAVPNIMLFHSRSAVRFNHTTRDLENFIHFVTNNTGLEPAASVTVLPEDFEGPLSSQVEQGRDWLLWLAWAFIIVCSTYGFFFSLYGQAVIARLRVLWLEHQHIE